MTELFHHGIFEVRSIETEQVHVPLLKNLKCDGTIRISINGFFDGGLPAEANCRVDLVSTFKVVTRLEI